MQMFFVVILFIGLAECNCPGENTSLAPLPIAREQNLSVCEEPYNSSNCACPALMFECACHKTGNCKRSRCVNMMWVHDGANACGDWSDELSDICPPGRFQCDCFNTTCTRGLGCIQKRDKCNGRIDCADGSDENNCKCPANKFECACFKTKNCTQQGCLKTELQCNGINSCGDWSDEVNCTRPADKFECACYKTKNCTTHLGGWINKLHVCDGDNTCGDWSDEVNCKTCPKNKFQCPCYRSNNCLPLHDGCIAYDQFCNGLNDCGDWSDEINCTSPADTFECACYKTKNCTYRHGWINKSFRCNEFDSCGDGSDEVNCTCPVGMFECACVASKECIGKDLNCIDRSLVCDGKPDCDSNTDETHYACNCSGTSVKCPSCDPLNERCSPNQKCIPFDMIGNGKKDCSGTSEEVCSASNITYQSCDSVIAITCPTETEVRNLVRHWNTPLECNGVRDERCTTDKSSCDPVKVVCTTPVCRNPGDAWRDVFFCENEQLIGMLYFCDGQSDHHQSCNDKSDELRQGFGFKCSGTARKGVCVLPQSNLFDSVAQCSDNSDMCFQNGQFRCFQCLDRKLIVSSNQVCDGIVDCFDISDECLCANQTLCRNIRGNCPFGQMNCEDRIACVGQEGVLCNTSVKCANQLNTKYCSITQESNECVADDKIYTEQISSNDSICDTIMKMSFRYYEREHAKFYYSKWCDGSSSDLEFGIIGEAYCPNRFSCLASGEVSIDQHKVCDGKIDCDDKSDEFLSRCKSVRYHCKNKVGFSIDKKHVCDGIVDCYDKSDEIKCKCESTRFYCTNEQPLSIDKRLVQNGIKDCADGSDECVNLKGDAFANVNEMIASRWYKAVFWITGICALVGNIIVIFTTSRGLIKQKRPNLINTSLFVLNLGIADLLMGVYLLAIVIKATSYSGAYCLFDKQWRSSNMCSAFGALAVLSSEGSAFVMTAMTTFRLLLAYKPFQMRHVKAYKIIVAGVFCWILAVLLAIIPLLNGTSEYFVTDVWYPNNFYDTDIVSRENMTLLAKQISHSKPKSWHDVRRILGNAFPRSSVNGEFGYYSETSVCMPRLYAMPGEFAWEYSTFLITTNFFLFMYMLVAYLLIFKQSNRKKETRTNDFSSKMQRKITVLILTNFCCWIPICVMGFLSVVGVKMSDDAYVLSACLLLPINSALNPLLYAKVLDPLLSKCMRNSESKTQPLRTGTSRSNTTTRHNLMARYNARAETVEVVETEDHDYNNSSADIVR